MLEYGDLSDHQRIAVDACVASIRDGARLTRLFGYAGTGKTTVSRIIAERSGKRAVFAAYTGKAAGVLTQKGCPAKTIHSLLYWPAGEVRNRKGEKEPIFVLDEDKLGGMVGLLVLDEVSMIGTKMGQDIMSLGIPVLAIGDPAQLKPPDGGTGYFMDRADAWLTKIERHDGMVLYLAQDIRKNGPRVIRRPEYADVSLGVIGSEEALEFDQILVGRNATRQEKNAKVRKLLGFDDEAIAPGERIICTENNHPRRTVNGKQFRVIDSDTAWRRNESNRITTMVLGCECLRVPDDVCPVCGWDNEREVPVWVDGFTGSNALAKKSFLERQKAIVATYGYAITVNKAQGSEWGSVLVVNESGLWKKEASNWLYTAVTRAQEEVAIVRLKKAG